MQERSDHKHAPWAMAIKPLPSERTLLFVDNTEVSYSTCSNSSRFELTPKNITHVSSEEIHDIVLGSQS